MQERQERRTSLLIADDNPTSRRTLVEYFDSLLQFAVIGEARTGDEAVELTRALRPELLILDDVLPCLDGLGVLASLGSDRPQAVLMLMSCPSDRLVQLYYQSGATYCLLRPTTPELIAQRAAFIMDCAQPIPVPVVNQPVHIRTVAEILRRAGVPAHLQGYRFLKDAVQYVLNTGDNWGMTKDVYPAVARIHETQPARVERSIRHAIEVAWNRADLTDLNRLFGATVNHIRGKPTNAEFVAMLADHLRGAAS
ncbi:MAG: sporulation initiation factor Spo0A C-terminal domain-containing protein [Mycobacterium leprae]